PTTASAGVREAVVQRFQRGLLFWNGDRKQIYELDSNPLNWFRFADTWQDGDPTGPFSTPIAGLYEPIRGFGKLWREQADVRSRLGWGLDPETGVSGVVTQEFEHGTMLLLEPTAARVLYANGAWDLVNVP
ncbi:MAG TPA: hypothetical protein VM536_12515, partial [Chloroflexia bacterium]|nr:hypothetical protein [Chloroflexia bacterium]